MILFLKVYHTNDTNVKVNHFTNSKVRAQYSGGAAPVDDGNYIRLSDGESAHS